MTITRTLRDFAEILIALRRGKQGDLVVHRADVDPRRFPELFADNGYIFEVNKEVGVAYWHLPNDAGAIDPAVAALDDDQMRTIHRILAAQSLSSGNVQTRADAEEYVTACIENGDASADDYDVAEIADLLYYDADSWDLDNVDHELFWDTVERHRKPTRASVMEKCDPQKAIAALVEIAAGLGSKAEWDSGDLEWIATEIDGALPECAPYIGGMGSATAGSIEFWTRVQETAGGEA